jgi:ATP-binding cassette subfamily C protein LapB
LTGRSGAHARFISSFVMNLALFVQQIATIGMVVWGVDIIAEGKLTTGALIASVILSGRALAPLQQLASLLTRYQYARATYRTLSELMRRPTERPRDRRFIHRPDIKGGFTLENVTFTYPRHKHEVLRELNLAIAPGERVAVLGRIGSGKSTLLKLMLGLYVPGSGAIRVDDVDLEQYDPADLRRRIGYVSQDARLFFGTLRDNVTLGMPRATDEAILEAARLSGLDRLVNTHPHGFDLVIGEHGEGLSGGQRQAVALARTILRQPSALLMDEPTSAMDHTSEQVFIQGMQRFLAGRTLVLVTHKPTLLTLVSRIVVIDGGKIVMDGPRDEVLKRLMRQEPGAAP